MRDKSSHIGGDSPLDLIKGHLTEIDNDSPLCDSLGSNSDFSFSSFPFSVPSSFSFLPVSRSHLPDEDQPKNWFRSSNNYIHPSPESPFHYVAKLQPFQSGGYEVTLTKIDFQQLVSRVDSSRFRGKREKGEQKPEDIESSINRSKRKVRHLIKSMGCDRLLTLTKRESDPDTYWTKDEWAAAWDKFNKLCKKAGAPISYVAVLEKHKKGNYHLHAAIVGHISVNLIRKIWLVCIGGGKGSGNVDIKMRRNCSEHVRRAGLAKYVSKYITKQADNTEFNKRRYWPSRHKLPEPRRYILNSEHVVSALIELAEYLGLNFRVLLDKAFMFEGGNGEGAWFAFDDILVAEPPF